LDSDGDDYDSFDDAGEMDEDSDEEFGAKKKKASKAKKPTKVGRALTFSGFREVLLSNTTTNMCSFFFEFYVPSVSSYRLNWPNWLLLPFRRKPSYLLLSLLVWLSNL
jgi:hypothetical protein